MMPTEPVDPGSPVEATAAREVVLVTGISGSGKSVALHALEDAGFFCIDNLPPELLRGFLQLEHRLHDQRVAIAVDVRSAGSLPHLLPLMTQLNDEGVWCAPSFSMPAPTRWCAASPRRAARTPCRRARDPGLVEAPATTTTRATRFLAISAS